MYFDCYFVVLAAFVFHVKVLRLKIKIIFYYEYFADVFFSCSFRGSRDGGEGGVSCKKSSTGTIRAEVGNSQFYSKVSKNSCFIHFFWK